MSKPKLISKGEKLDPTQEMELTLKITDPDSIQELSQYRVGWERNAFALQALRIGILAVRQASGSVDAQAVRNEGERIVGDVRKLLDSNLKLMMSDVSKTLGTYFDPRSGQLPQRIEALVKKDGELERVLKEHLGDDSSSLAKTLQEHVGEDSALLRALSMDDSNGFLVGLTETLQGALSEQREKIVGEFSLDSKGSALSKLIQEITEKNGDLSKDLKQTMIEVSKEFSLDNEEGALSRLVRKVEASSEVLSKNLTLDDKDSSLSRLRRELIEVMEIQKKQSEEFQKEVRSTLETFQTRKKEAARSTTHGDDFENLVNDYLQTEATRLGDIFKATGNTTGKISHCKVGDQVITLGKDTPAPGQRIVFEAKENKSYDLAEALKELETARTNREATVGVFVFSSKVAPEGIEPFARHGNDLVVVWDSEDPNSDVYLRASLLVARALLIQEERGKGKSTESLEEMKKAFANLTKELDGLTVIKTSAETGKRSIQKIIDKVELMEQKVAKYTDTLKRSMEGV